MVSADRVGARRHLLLVGVSAQASCGASRHTRQTELPPPSPRDQWSLGKRARREREGAKQAHAGVQRKNEQQPPPEQILGRCSSGAPSRHSIRENHSVRNTRCTVIIQDMASVGAGKPRQDSSPVRWMSSLYPGQCDLSDCIPNPGRINKKPSQDGERDANSRQRVVSVTTSPQRKRLLPRAFPLRCAVTKDTETTRRRRKTGAVGSDIGEGDVQHVVDLASTSPDIRLQSKVSGHHQRWRKSTP